MNTALQTFCKKNNKKHIIFDFDETIVQLRLPWNLFWTRRKEGLQKLGIDLNELDSQPTYDVDAINAIIKKHGQIVWDMERKISTEFEENHLLGYEINSDLTEFMISHAHDLTFYLWSTNTRNLVKKLLDEIGIIDYFHTIVTKDDVMYVKPEVEGFLKINPDNKIPMDEFLFVGNSMYTDKIAAEKLGIDFFLVDYFS